MVALDWNWFFSSVAQSAAAMVGVIAAFLIAKVLSHQAAFHLKRDELPKLLAECDRVASRLGQCGFKYIEDTHFMDWDVDVESDFNEHRESDPAVVYERLEMEKQRDDWIDKSVVLGWIKQKLEALEAEKARIEAEERQREFERQERRAAREKLRASHPNGLASLLGTMNGLHDLHDQHFNTKVLAPPRISLGLGTATQFRWTRIPGYRQEISDATQEARHHVRKVTLYLDGVAGNPERSSLVTFTLVLLALLFFGGVVYPLSFLPAPTNGEIVLSFAAFWEILFSLKGLVLVVLSLGVVAILAVFGYINLSLVHKSDDLNRLGKFTKMSAYSSRLSYLDRPRQEQENPATP